MPRVHETAMLRRQLHVQAAFAVAFLAALLAGGAASRGATEPEFAFGLGYTHISLDDTTVGDMGQEGGFYMEPRFSIAPWDERPELRIGIGFGLSFFYDETDGSALFIDDDGDVFIADADDYESMYFFTPELQISWRQRFDNGWHFEGGVGLGGTIAFYSAGEEFFNDFYDEQLDETDATFTARPFVRGGFHFEAFTFGLEGSYLWGGSLDLAERIGGDLEQWQVGAFFAWTH
jgi:hypothetical protein